MITTSTGSPRLSRLGIAWGVLPIEGPDAVTTVLPVADWNSGKRARYAAENSPEIITLTSAECAAPARRKTPAASSAVALEAIELHLMDFQQRCDDIMFRCGT